ncbi:MAG TPA: ATP-dependent sacrificial sulfur transferase LarE [Thermodesulfobacteriota bacterium]|nr:ATP-dependent sacrificial sulfur transferase LarE [Thermodesulfobacteriota bacterium]
MKKKRGNLVPDSSLNAKVNSLRKILRDMGKILLAFSGVVDSTFLLKIAHEELSEDTLAVTAVSPIHPTEEYESACQIARSFKIKHLMIETQELKNPTFWSNPPDRCYFCKKELFQTLQTIARQEGIAFVIDASTMDDLSDFRPGRTAAQEEGIRSPLIEAKLTKKEIRIISQEKGLPTWDKPSMACLASRFPYGEFISLEKIKRVACAENFLRGFGFSQVRVRSHDKLARIEVDAGLIQKLTNPEFRERIINELKHLGFIYLTVDLEGYRTGSHNEVLTVSEKVPPYGRG